MTTETKPKKSSRGFYILVGIMAIMFGTLNAQNPTPPKPLSQSATLTSPHCDEAKIRALAGSALTAVEEISPSKFKITLNTTVMTFSELTKKMQQAGCF